MDKNEIPPNLPDGTYFKNPYGQIFCRIPIEIYSLDGKPLNSNTSLKGAVEFTNITDKIALWQAIKDNLPERNKLIVEVVIRKFKGKSHADICEEVYGKNIIDPIGKIKSLKPKAQYIANKYDLPMPEWDSRKA